LRNFTICVSAVVKVPRSLYVLWGWWFVVLFCCVQSRCVYAITRI